jgi:hypothetical protein
MLTLTLLSLLAQAQDAPAEAGSDEEMIVFGDLEEQRRRQDLTATLLDLGYRPGRDRNSGRTVYRPEVAWHPSVIIDDDGYAIIRRSPVRFEPWVEGRSNLKWISCIPPFTVMCVRIGGRVVSERKLRHKKQFVAEGIDPALDVWREVLVANAMGRRLGEDIPDMLEAVWQHGEVPLGDPLEAYSDRRAAILTFWASRACTPEGAAARELAADFVRYEIQASAHPVPADEQAAAESASLCGDRLGLE